MKSPAFRCFTRIKTSVVSCLLVLLAAGLRAEDCGFSALTRARDVELRIASYNVYYSSCIPADDGGPSGNGDDRVENFVRIVKAMDADILALQEVFHAPKYFLTKTPEGILDHMESITGEKWDMAHDYDWTPENPPTGDTGRGGRFIFSRYPIVKQGTFSRRITWALIKLPPRISDKRLLVLNVHFSANSQAYKTGQFVTDVVKGKMEPKIPSDVMIMVTGDFNGQPNKARYDAVFHSKPSFQDLRPTHLGWDTPNDTTIGFTKFNKKGKPVDIYHKVLDTGEPMQKRIDYMAWHSDHLLSKHACILNPLIMNQATLDTYGLHQIDTALNPKAGLKPETLSDHWPYFADFYDPNKKEKKHGKSSKAGKGSKSRSSKAEKKNIYTIGSDDKASIGKSSKADKDSPSKSSEAEKESIGKSSKADKDSPSKSSEAEKESTSKSSKADKDSNGKTSIADKDSNGKSSKSDKESKGKSSKSEKESKGKSSKSDKESNGKPGALISFTPDATVQKGEIYSLVATRFDVPPPTPKISHAPTRPSRPSVAPSSDPSIAPSSVPSSDPSIAPSSVPSSDPSSAPSSVPSSAPSVFPSGIPSVFPSDVPSDVPSMLSSGIPSVFPSDVPSVSSEPSSIPTISSQPSVVPSISYQPSFEPSVSNAPTVSSRQNLTFSGLTTDSLRTIDVPSASSAKPFIEFSVVFVSCTISIILAFI